MNSSVVSPKKLVSLLILLSCFSGNARAERLQVGAFEERENARKRARVLKQWNYNVEFETSPEGYTRVRTDNLTENKLTVLVNKLRKKRISFIRVPESEAPTQTAQPSIRKVSEPYFRPSITEKLETVMGTPYQWGGAAPQNGFDCSGLLYWLLPYSSMPRTARKMWNWTEEKDRSELQKGDFLFFDFGRRTPPDHVGLYLGDRRFVHASDKYGVTKATVSDTYYQNRLYGIGRPPAPLPEQE